MTDNTITYTGIKVSGKVFYTSNKEDMEKVSSILRGEDYYILDNLAIKYPYIIIFEEFYRPYKYRLIIQYYKEYDIIKTNTLRIENNL